MPYFNLKLKKAKKDDFLYGKEVLFGKMYFVYSIIQQEIQGPHYLFDGEYLEEFASFLKQGRIYVPVTSIGQDRKPKLKRSEAMAS